MGDERGAFRPMRRERQALTRPECEALLTSEKRGVLSVLGDGGYPYGIPINHFYCPEDGRIYFHGGRAGHRVDAVRACDKVSFCVFDRGENLDGDWSLYVRSVIVFGRIELVEDRETVYDISRRLSLRFTDDEAYIAREIEKSGPATLLMALTPEHMTGKLVHES